MRTFSITIDGPAGAGKSTLARRLAETLGFLYVDTGALYRAVGLFVAKKGKNTKNPSEVIPLLHQIDIEMKMGADGIQHMFLQGEDVTEEIRLNQVSQYASQVSAIPEVRDFLMETQRGAAKTKNVVMDGRDIGTVVLPDADIKIFLTASPEKRAERRQKELQEKGTTISFEKLLADIQVRDEADMNRSIAPLKPAGDAIIVDTSNLDLEESLIALQNIVTHPYDALIVS